MAWRRTEGNSETAEPIRARFTDATFGWGADFSRACLPVADFTRADFGDSANFMGAKFGPANFTRATFGDAVNFTFTLFVSHANFTDAVFGHSADFTCAVLGYEELAASILDYSPGATFTRVTFGILADFRGAAFGKADFTRATFGITLFNGATFGDDATFIDAAFDGVAEFAGTAFGHEADFNQTHFKDRVEFAAMSENQWTKIFEEQWARKIATALGMDEKARAALEKRHRHSWETTGSGPDRFLTISFARARFDGEAVFSDRSFEQIANFANARFCSPPDFEWCGGTARIDFTGAHIGFARPGHLHWTKDTEVPVCLRALRKIAEETKNHDLERDLYIEERKAERGVYWRKLSDELKEAPEELRKKLEHIDKQKKDAWSEWRLQRRARNAHRLGVAIKVAQLAVHGFWIAVMGVFWAFADYGRSFVRPAVWLIASGFFFYWCYGKILAPLMPKAGPLADQYAHAVGMVALGNAVPFVGPLTIEGEVKKFLFCAGVANCLPIPPEGFQLLVVGQNVLSITLVFFIGLALRNYFRIK